MSSSSSVGGAGSGLYQFLQKVSANQPAQGTQGTGSFQGAGGTPTGTPPTAGVKGAGGHHHGGGKGGAMMSKIDSAVTDALNSSSASDDPNQTIEDAIAKVLSGNSDSTSSTTATTTPSKTDGTDATDQASNDSSTRQAFFNTLQEHGIDPNQFRQDLMSAMKQAKEDGSFDRSTAYASVPAGVAVDVAA